MPNKNKSNSETALIWFFMFIVWVVMAVLLAGCQIPEVEPLLPTTPGQALAKTIIKTDWIVSLAIVGFAISTAAFINGNKMAAGTAVGCGAALILQLTIVRYAAIVTWLGLVLSIGLLLYTFYIKHKAFKEVVLGVQTYKENNETLEQCLKKQSGSTKKLVNQIKKKNKSERKTI